MPRLLLYNDSDGLIHDLAFRPIDTCVLLDCALSDRVLQWVLCTDCNKRSSGMVQR